MKQQTIDAIQNGQTALGIELGSTRIKAVLIDEHFQTIATGSHEWENQLVDGIWTYSLDAVWQGIQASYRALATSVQEKYNVALTKIGSIGFSAMMHGYLAFDQNDQLLVPFRTWRNASTEEAERKLTDLFQYNIPQRWSIAHLYQAILNREEHVPKINFLTTLAGYVHWQLTGEKVIGIGDASGMFPIDNQTKDYHQSMLNQFNDLIASEHFSWQVADILPKVLVAGEAAGMLSDVGALLLDPTGTLLPGIPFCPPEGDAGTGMVATNSVAQRSGNVSAGTSAFAMIVLEKGLSQVYPEIDLVTTPAGDLVGMVHTNNCTSEINAWVKIFREFAEAAGMELSSEELFTTLFNQALKGDPECGGMLSYGYYSGENITQMPAGRPLFVRSPESKFNLANFMRLHLFSAFGAMKIGMDILAKEHVEIDRIVGHGGIFKTPVVAQRVLAAAMGAPVTVMENAGEGGAWGIALLAMFVRNSTSPTLTDFLTQVFQEEEGMTLAPTPEDVAGFSEFVKRYQQGLTIEQAAIDNLI
jgi:sugar (pentulose or hexulose) kinase